MFVEGNIGCGKTTFLEHFRQFEDITLQGWNLLDLMYKDPTKWAMAFQAYVSLTMLDMHQRPTATSVKLVERSLYSERYCFVEQIHRSETLHPAQFSALDVWFRFIHNEIPIQADLIVYLSTNPVIAHERLHEDWLVNRTHAERPAPELVIDADLDPSQITKEYKRTEHQILRKAVDMVMWSLI